MPTTPNRGFPYPSGAVGVPPDVPGDIYKLALAVDTAFGPGTSTAGAPTAWTPHFNFATTGNGTNVGVYWYTAGGKILNGKFDWTWGSTSTMSATTPFTIDLPNGAVAAANFTNIGSGSIKDFSADGVYHVDLLLSGSASTFALYLSAASTSGSVKNDGTPFTFAAGDHIAGTFSVYVN